MTYSIISTFINTLFLFMIVSVAIPSLGMSQELNEEDIHWNDHHDTSYEGSSSPYHKNLKQTPMPKDKILLNSIKTLVFYRHKRTTARRTHSIPQLSCVGGTAGCKLFTPDEVQCEMADNSKKDRTQIKWKCIAQMSDKVRFNHVEVICEGYDYPEDDYILLGSCGLEFTLDHTDPYDHHEKSYYHHMDEQEKKMHQERVRKLDRNNDNESIQSVSLMSLAYLSGIVAQSSLLMIVSISILFGITILFAARYTYSKYSTNGTAGKGIPNPVRGLSKRPTPWASNYLPLASAVLSTKKAC